MSERQRPWKPKAPESGSATRPKAQTSRSPRADLPRRAPWAGLAEFPRRMWQAGNAAISQIAWQAEQQRAAARSTNPGRDGTSLQERLQRCPCPP